MIEVISRKFYLSDALTSLYAGKGFSIINEDYDQINWGTINPIPSKEVLEAEVARLQTEYDAQKYVLYRQAEYPSYLEYLDGIVKNDTVQQQAYIDAYLAVDAKYPATGE